MKKTITLFLILLFTQSVQASYVDIGEFITFSLNPNLMLQKRSYIDDFPTYHGCFAYLNKQNAILNGKPFFIEYACVQWNPNLNDGSFPIVDGSTFYYKENNGYSQIQSSPFYFKKSNVLYDIEAFFTNFKD